MKRFRIVTNRKQETKIAENREIEYNAGDAGRALSPENRYEAERERMKEEEAQLKVRELRVEKLLKSLALLRVGAIYNLSSYACCY